MIKCWLPIVFLACFVKSSREIRNIKDITIQSWYFCGLSFFAIFIPHGFGFCTLFTAPLLHTALWCKKPNFRKGVFFLLIYSHNLMNPQTESRAKKRGEKREDRAREKEVTSAKLSLSQTYHHHHHNHHYHFKSSWSTTSGAATSEGGGRGRAV